MRYGFLGVSQCQRPRRVSRIEAKYSLEKCSMGKRLKIIELGKYNSAEELLIETRTTGSQGHVYYQGADCQGSSPALPYRTQVRVSLCHYDLQDGVSCPQMDWFTLGRSSKCI